MRIFITVTPSGGEIRVDSAVRDAFPCLEKRILENQGKCSPLVKTLRRSFSFSGHCSFQQCSPQVENGCPQRCLPTNLTAKPILSSIFDVLSECRIIWPDVNR